MIRRPTPTTTVAALLIAALTLTACEPRSGGAPKVVGCTAEEMRTRKARTTACRAEFQALLERAEADRQRASALPKSPHPSARERF